MSNENLNENKPKRTRATKKAAESAPVEVSNVAVQEMDNNSVTEEGQKVITGPKKVKPTRVSNMHSKESGAVSSRAADYALRSKRVIKEEKTEDSKVALWSEKNIRWSDVGSLSKGYNIVTEEAAEKWLTKVGIRKATPEEVATYYGV